MDVISLSKANKAKKAMSALQSRLGEGEHKSGELDIKDVHANAKERLDELETDSSRLAPLMRLSDLEAHTNINLNKHNLRVNALLEKSKYELKEVVVDDFGDATGIDSALSSNITHDAENHSVIVTSAEQPGVVVTVSESLDYMPVFFSISAVSKENNSAFKMIQTDIVKPKADDNGYYKVSEEWVSKVVDIGEVMTFLALQSTKTGVVEKNTGETGEGMSIDFYTSTSIDNINFTPFALYEDDEIQSPAGRYIKVKAFFNNKKEDIKKELTIEPDSENENIHNQSGNLSLISVNEIIRYYSKAFSISEFDTAKLEETSADSILLKGKYK